MGQQVPAACGAPDTIDGRNGKDLHPQVHWTMAVEKHLHGPATVISCLWGSTSGVTRLTAHYPTGGSFAGSIGPVDTTVGQRRPDQRTNVRQTFFLYGYPTVGALPQTDSRRHGHADAASHLTLLRVLLSAAIASSAVHYMHNFVMASMYPPLPPLLPDAQSFRIGILVAWPALTAVGLWGYTQYVAGRMRRAGWAFVVYSAVGVTTIGHFLGPTPEIPTFFFVTIFTDFITGMAMLIFGIATVRSAEPKD
jgi:hypothetical protein